MDGPKHWLPVTKTSTSRRHWLLTIPKFWNSLVMDEWVARDLAKSYERERERSTQVNLKKWTAMLLSAKRLKVPYHWTAWLWERGRDHIESPFFFFHLYFIKNPSPNSHTKPLSLSLICISSTSLSAIGFLSVLSQVNTIRLPHSFHFLKTLCPWDSFKSSPKQLSHVLLSPAIGFVFSWVNTQHHPICLFHSTSWNPLFLGTRLSHLRSDSVLNTSGPMTWQIQLDRP